jgi:hypothetical protein
MRTVVAPLDQTVQRQLQALPADVQDVARGYLRLLRLDPHAGAPVKRGALATYRARRIYMNAGDQPANVLGRRHHGSRSTTGTDETGPKWRLIYLLHEAPRTGVRVVQVLAIGHGHPDRGPSAYELAERRLPRPDHRTEA